MLYRLLPIVVLMALASPALPVGRVAFDRFRLSIAIGDSVPSYALIGMLLGYHRAHPIDTSLFTIREDEAPAPCGHIRSTHHLLPIIPL
jgi:hypothetical protein